VAQHSLDVGCIPPELSDAAAQEQSMRVVLKPLGRQVAVVGWHQVSSVSTRP
jgi:hypothetical protein